MKDLFIGMALVFLDVNFSVQGHSFDVLPDFVGYYLMLRELEQLAIHSNHFRKAHPWAKGMAIFSLVIYVFNALAVTIRDQFWSFCLGFAAQAIGLLIGYWIVSGVRELERKRNWRLGGEKLFNLWLYMTVITMITYASSWIPLVGAVGVIGALVMNLCFLAAFYRTMKVYEAKK